MGVSGRAELRRLVDDFGKIPIELKRELRPRIREAAAPTVDKARAKASWSKRIPGAIKVSQSLGKNPGIKIVVSAKAAPHARPYEHSGKAGFFRHPVYGNRKVWAVQRARPFLFQTVAEDATSISERIADLVPEVAARYRFH